jgi:O-acetyl-ADP-ribose deacetylase (regulator of RNase III)
VEGDITRQDTDAIVNAANAALRPGGGVDGAIHRAGGPAIAAEGRRLGGCPTGEARITTGGNLKAKYVIHTVGPVYRDGCQQEPELLASCYRESLKLASAQGINSLAFPSISTVIYGYPIADAASGPYHRNRLPGSPPGNRDGALRVIRAGAYEAYAKVLRNYPERQRQAIATVSFPWTQRQNKRPHRGWSRNRPQGKS